MKYIGKKSHLKVQKKFLQFLETQGKTQKFREETRKKAWAKQTKLCLKTNFDIWNCKFIATVLILWIGLNFPLKFFYIVAFVDRLVWPLPSVVRGLFYPHYYVIGSSFVLSSFSRNNNNTKTHSMKFIFLPVFFIGDPSPCSSIIKFFRRN